MRVPQRKDIGAILVEKGFMAEGDLEKAVNLSRQGGMRIGEACLRLGFIKERQFAEAIAEQYGLEVIELTNADLDKEILNLIPADLLHRSKVVPVTQNGTTILATADPTDILVIDDIERMIEEGGGTVSKVAVAAEKDIESLLNRGGGAKRVLKEVAEGFDLEVLKVSEDSEDVLSIEKIAEDSSPVVKLVDTTIYDALSRRASDIHLESSDKGLFVKYRLDGVLHKAMGPIDKRFQASIISRVKVMSELDISERRVPQDGRFKIRFKDKTIDFRVSIMPSIHGEDAVIRVLDKEHITREFRDLSLDILGFSDGAVRHIRRMIREPYGMVLVTGPTGSGKTTTLYAAVSAAQIAIQAALTGHLVFTTVHANNVFDVIGRFIHMGIEPYNFVSAMNCILAQRLVRLICPRCKRAVKVPPEVLSSSGIDPQKYGNTTFYEGAGCDECYSTGYKRRKGILEILELSDEVRDMIAGKHPLSVIKKKALDDGMVPLRQVAVECALRGETTLEEINRVTFVE
jgi:type II secretory ATPase GspE/PulE/Tfp pilus assembly ATPase PilB-like protein